ncbi:MAG: WG repeat-containing protein [Prevotella sp.]|nr:WG repeat-containing protein [Prevotella sp.]
MCRLFKKTVLLATASLIVASCAKTEKHEAEYLAVQMSKGDSWSIIDKDGKEVVVEEYPADATFSSVTDGAYWVKQDGTYQLFSINSPKQPLCDLEFSKVTAFYAGHAAVSTPNLPIRIINTKGQIVAALAKSIKKCSRFWNNGYAAITSTDGKMGIVDTKGRIVVDPKYSWISISEDDDYYMAQRDGDAAKNIFIFDFTGKQIGKIDSEKYALLSGLSERKILVRDASSTGDTPLITLDVTGKKLFEIKKSVSNSWVSEEYADGYFVFSTGDGKCGVVDDEGKTVIRAKYNQMNNLGQGRFAAKKGDEWGVVNAKDETILPFDYDYVMATAFGSNFLVRDGSSWTIVDKEGKEQASFDNYSWGGSNYEVDYIDLASIADAIKMDIEDFEAVESARGAAQKWNMDIDNYHYSHKAYLTINIDEKIKGQVTIWFDDNMAEEKTHQESVNDGWFTTTHTVSDGWQWTDAQPTRITGTLNITDSSISAKDLYKQLGITTNTNIETKNGKKRERRTSVQEGNDNINFEITFNYQ